MKAIPKTYMDINWIKQAVDAKKLTQLIGSLGSVGGMSEVKKAAEARLRVLLAGVTETDKAAARSEREQGNAFVKESKYEEALPHYKRSVELDPLESATYGNMALVHLRMKDYKAALENANRALSIKREFLRAYQRRAEAYYNMQKYYKAYASIMAFLLEDPDNVEVPSSFTHRRASWRKPSKMQP